MMTSEKNRLIKVLEAANIKLSSVVSKIYGVSSLALIRSLLEKDKLSREEISQLAKGKLKKKVDLLEKALNGKLTDHHRFLLGMHLENIDHLARQIKKIDEEIQRKMLPFQTESKLIQTIPGISEVNASAILAELVLTCLNFPMKRIFLLGQEYVQEIMKVLARKKVGKRKKEMVLRCFTWLTLSYHEIGSGARDQEIDKPDSKPLSPDGLVNILEDLYLLLHPHQTARNQGNSFLKGALTESAWSASKTKGTSYSAYYHSLVGRRGKKRALVALAHRILIDIYLILMTGEPYRDIGAKEVCERATKRRMKSMIRSLEKAGYSIVLATTA